MAANFYFCVCNLALMLSLHLPYSTRHSQSLTPTRKLHQLVYHETCLSSMLLCEGKVCFLLPLYSTNHFVGNYFENTFEKTFVKNLIMRRRALKQSSDFSEKLWCTVLRHKETNFQALLLPKAFQLSKLMRDAAGI